MRSSSATAGMVANYIGGNRGVADRRWVMRVDASMRPWGGVSVACCFFFFFFMSCWFSRDSGGRCRGRVTSWLVVEGVISRLMAVMGR